MLLVIGYGNELRRDDSVGPRLARALANDPMAGVVGLAVHQLTPELAEMVGRAETVVFIDAFAGDGAAEVTLQRIQAGTEIPWGHVSSPQTLLALAEALWGHCPQAWLLTVPGKDFDFGEGLSAEGETGFVRGLHLLLSTFALRARPERET